MTNFKKYILSRTFGWTELDITNTSMEFIDFIFEQLGEEGKETKKLAKELKSKK